MFRSYLVVALSFLALFWAPSTTAISENHPVLDMDGNELQSGVDYHVVSAHNGGGLSLASRKGRFPFDVMLHSRETKSGKRIRFSPASSSSSSQYSSMDGVIRTSLLRPWAAAADEMIRASQSVIHESTDLNIRFSSVPTVWQLGEPDRSGRRYVMIGGEAGHPGSSTVNNWFKIERAHDRAQEHSYMLVHCPGVCGSCKTKCGALGISSQGGRRWLSLSNRPLRVMFVRAEDS